MALTHQAELASFFGVSRTTIQVWQGEGMPVLSQAKGNVKTNSYDTVAVLKWWLNRELSKITGGPLGDDLNYEAERARLTKAQADKQELDVAARRGELLAVDDVRKHWQSMVFAAKAKLLAVPVKAAPAVITAQTTAEVFDLLSTMIREALDELSASGEPTSSDDETERGAVRLVESSTEANNKSVGRRKPTTQQRSKRRAGKMADK